ncbi:MAG: DUF6493 family protein [Tunicatimonas sp.]
MIHHTQFFRLLANERIGPLIPFLRSLTEVHKITLAPYLQALNEDYLTFSAENGPRGRRASSVQAQMLALASFVCLDRASLVRTNVPDLLLQERVLDAVLPWYCPSWFSDYVNDYAEAHYLPASFSYDYLIRMMQHGWVRPHEAVITQFLPQLIYELRGPEWIYCPENLTRHEVTVREHLWYLFRYETNVNWSDRHLLYGAENEHDTDWKYTLKLLAAGRKIDRHRLLKETVEAASRSFNPALHQWFLDLLDYLEPTPEELLFATTQPLPEQPPQGIRSIAEVCQELHASAKAASPGTAAPARERRPLPEKPLSYRDPHPNPRQIVVSSRNQ